MLMCRKTTIKQTSKSLNNKFTLGCVTYLIYITVLSFSMFCKRKICWAFAQFTMLCYDSMSPCFIRGRMKFWILFARSSDDQGEFFNAVLWWMKDCMFASVLKNMTLKSCHFSGWACRHHLILMWTVLVHFVSCSYACVWAGSRYIYK